MNEIPTIEGQPADLWWKAYSKSMREVGGEKWLTEVLDDPSLEKEHKLLLRALQMAQAAHWFRVALPRRLKAKEDKERLRTLRRQVEGLDEETLRRILNNITGGADASSGT